MPTTARSPSGAGYTLNISTCAEIGAVRNDTLWRFTRTSRANIFSPNLTLNLVSAGQSPSGVKVTVYGFVKFHFPRIAGDILMALANSVAEMFVLNAGAPGPDT